MKNINRFLASSYRCDLFGFNMASRGMSRAGVERRAEKRNGGTTPAAQWDEAQLGMHGTLCLGHQVPIDDAVKVSITADGKEIKLHPVRNFWTPAYMETIYRSEIDSEYYPNSGTLAVKEKKAILREDVFVSHIKITNQKREASSITVKLSMPLTELTDTVYSVDTVTVPQGLYAEYKIRGYAALDTDKGGRVLNLTIPAKASLEFSYSMAFAILKDGQSAAEAAVKRTLALPDPFKNNEECFNKWFFDNVPELETENEDLKKVYYYRYYVLYRSIHAPSLWVEDHPIPGTCMYESPYGWWFGTVIGLPIPWQISEARWIKDSEPMRSQIRNFCDGRVCHQEYIQFTPFVIWNSYRLNKDKAFLEDIYDGCANYCKKLLSGETPPLTEGSWDTGAEYQPAFYQHTEEPWDWRHDQEGKRDYGFKIRSIYRLDHIGYNALSLIGCASIAGELGKKDDEEIFRSAAERMIAFIKNKMWNDEKCFFFDYDPEAGKQCDEAVSYDGFVPFITDAFGTEYFDCFKALFDEELLASDYGATTSARTCPMFWYDNCITGPTAATTAEPHEYGCSWNGTVWPYANSVISEALGRAASLRGALRADWLEFFKRYTELHFIYGDRSTPLVCEHYRTDDGATFSPYFDYFHSSWIDQFMHFYAGIDIGDDGALKFEPYADEPFALYGVHIGNKVYDLIRDAGGECKMLCRGE